MPAHRKYDGTTPAERRRQQEAAYRERHKAELAAKKRQYYEAHRDEILAYHRSIYDLEAARRKNLPKLYGITVEQYEAMVASQNGRCAICGTEFLPSTRRCVDHDHNTGLVRGVLCTQCNGLLGMAGDSRVILLAAVEYLMTAKRNASSLPA